MTDLQKALSEVVPTDDVDYDGAEVSTGEDVERKAAERGLVVRYPKSNELFIDIDSWEQLARHVALLGIYERLVPGCSSHRTPSPSGRLGRFHVVVGLPHDVASEEERLMLQAFLGSDTKRELLGYKRLKRGADPRRCNCFFEKSEKVDD